MAKTPVDFDVVVVGGGAAGVAAAVGAARAGASVCLIERHGYLGGTAIASSVLTYCGFFDRSHTQVIAGVGQSFLSHLEALDLYLTHSSKESGNKVVLLDLETTKRVLDSMIDDAGVTLFLHTNVFAATTDGVQITGVEASHPGGRLSLTARAFVDCSGDGTLLEAAGAKTMLSPVLERQASTLVMRVGGVEEGSDLSKNAMVGAVKAYESASGVSLGRDHGATVRLPLSREVMMLVVDGYRDMLDIREATKAELEGRRTAVHYLHAMQASVPGWQSSYLAATGPEMGVRETRRMLGLESISAVDIAMGRKRPEDVIARGGWPMEDHSVPGEPSYSGIKDNGWFDVPYGSIASAEFANLWAGGRLVSSEPRAFASVRVMGTAFGTGHAGGVAAASFAETGSSNVMKIQETLLKQGALL